MRDAAINLRALPEQRDLGDLRGKLLDFDAVELVHIHCQAQVNVDHLLAVLVAPRRFVWNPTVRIAGRSRARWACGQAAFEPVHMSTGQ